MTGDGGAPRGSVGPAVVSPRSGPRALQPQGRGEVCGAAPRPGEQAEEGKDVVDHGALAVPVRAKVVGAGTPLGVQALADLRFLGESSSLWKIIQRVVLKT